MITHILLGPYADPMPRIAETVFAEGISALATLLAASSIGALIVAGVMRFYAGRFHLLRTLVVCSFASFAAVVLFAATTNLWVGEILVAALGGLLTAIGIAAFTLVQMTVDNAYGGHVISIMLALYIGALSPGTLGVGWLAEFARFQRGLAAAAVLSAVAAVALMRITLRRGADALRSA